MNKKMNIQVIKICILIIVCTAITLFLEKYYYTLPFSIERDAIVFTVLTFIGLNFIVNREKMYDFIYRKRYFIGATLLFLLVAFGLHGSSISFWHHYIQPDYYKVEYQPILGEARAIRSDEWVVNTPLDLSQSKLKNPFDSINNITRGTDTSVALIAKPPIKTINVLVNPSKIAYLFFGNEIGMSFWWFGRLFALFFLSFEMLMIITSKNKKISLIGTLLITFAPVVQWWFSTPIVDILIFGNAAVITLNSFFKTNKKKVRFLLAIAMGIIGSQYICIYYPAWQISFGYVYLILFIWLLYKNKEKINIKLLGYVFIVVAIIAALVGYMLYDSKEALEIILNTAYPGKRISTGGAGWQLLFTYFSSYLYSFKDIANPCENSQFFCLFPLPLILGVIQIVKNKKNHKKCDILLWMLVALSILLMVWNFIELPGWLAKITLLSMSTPQRSQVTVGYLMILLLLYLLSNYKEGAHLEQKISFVISLIIIVFGLSVVEKLIPDYMTTVYIAFVSIIAFALMYTFLSNSKKHSNFILYTLAMMTIIPGITVNPICKGLDVMYDKPLAKKIQEIVRQDPDSKWLVSANYYLTPNYFIANGAPTINSVNVYPNLELWKKFDPEGVYEDIYNRYAHIVIEFSNEPSSYRFTENYYDLITLTMNYNDIEKSGVKYIASDTELDEKIAKKYKLKKIYDEYGKLIYQLMK